MKILNITRILFAILIISALAFSLYFNISEAAAQKSAENEIILFVENSEPFIDEISEYLKCDRKDIYQSRIDESDSAIGKLNSFESMLSYIEDSYNAFISEASNLKLNSENKEDYDIQKKNEQYSRQIIELRKNFNNIRDNFQMKFMETEE